MAQDAGERLVAGRWTLHTPLRRAQRGVTWRAAEVATGRRLAVEQLRLPEGADPGGPGQAALWERVAAEARTAASLTAPALVPLEDVVVEDGVVFVASELVDALTLDELVARRGPLPARRVAQLGLELLDALEAVHAAGLAHLDLRPANVLITPGGRARLAGAGLATLRAELRPGSERPATAFLAPNSSEATPRAPGPTSGPSGRSSLSPPRARSRSPPTAATPPPSSTGLPARPNAPAPSPPPSMPC